MSLFNYQGETDFFQIFSTSLYVLSDQFLEGRWKSLHCFGVKMDQIVPTVLNQSYIRQYN